MAKATTHKCWIIRYRIEGTQKIGCFATDDPDHWYRPGYRMHSTGGEVIDVQESIFKEKKSES